MGLMGLLMAYYGGLQDILSGLTKSTDHPSTLLGTFKGFTDTHAQVRCGSHLLASQGARRGLQQLLLRERSTVLRVHAFMCRRSCGVSYLQHQTTKTARWVKPWRRTEP